MLKKIILLSMTASLFSCGLFGEKTSANQTVDTMVNPTRSTGVEDTLPGWTYIITNNSVGTISINSDVSAIKQLLPSNYSVVYEKLSFDGDDEESLSDVATIKNGANVTLYILVDEANKERIRSLIVLDPRYKLENTDISVGMLVGELLKQIKVKDVYFNISDGLYIISENFSGSFKIDLKGRGDQYESLKDLPTDCCVEQIIVTSQE